MFKKIYEKLNLNPNDIADGLLKIPQKPKVQAKFQTFKSGSVQQADLLYLPTDNGFKYALVVVDVVSHAMDAEPLKNKETSDVLKAFKAIYKRKYLNLPSDFLQVDSGTEFKGQVKKYFNDNNVIIRVGRTGRHKQQAVVETYNGFIAKALLSKMADEEQRTRRENRKWVKFLPIVISVINEYQRKEPSIESMLGDPICYKKTGYCELLPVGTKVRVILEQPLNIADKRLTGKFRTGDRRWENETRTVDNVLLKPNQPPMYMVSGIKNASFLREELQEIKSTEQEYYIVQKILKKVSNKPVKYLVKWKNYKEPTVEPRSSLIKDVPDMVKEFEANNK